MNQPLREVTNLQNNNCPQAIPDKKQHQLKPQIQEILALNHSIIDFGGCIPGSVHQRKLSITLKQAQKMPKIISMCILCDDILLTELPEYIFGVRKENTFEYFDEFKFKAAQRGIYNFVVGVKTPSYSDYNVEAKLVIFMEGTIGSLIIDLKQITVLPELRCPKELINEDGQRLIKLGVIQNKSKKQTKIVFKCNQNLNFTLFTELLGLIEGDQGHLQVKPKIVQIAGKGVFVLTFVTNCPSHLTRCMTERKVLVLRIKDSNIHFHFPIEVTFYPENKKGLSLME